VGNSRISELEWLSAKPRSQQQHLSEVKDMASNRKREGRRISQQKVTTSWKRRWRLFQKKMRRK